MRFLGDSIDDGFKYRIAIHKTSGKVTGALRYYVENDTYNPNDLGFLQSNNIQRWTGELNYNIYKPFWRLNKMFNYFAVTYARQYKPNTYRDFSLNGSTVLIFKSFFAMGGGFEWAPAEIYDYYEPRVPGRYFINPGYWGANAWISTNYVNPFALDIRVHAWDVNREDDIHRVGVYYDVSPRYRVSDRFSFIAGFNQDLAKNETGYAATLGDTIIFGTRNKNTITQWLTAKYIFSNRMGLNLIGRHYWARATYNDFFALTEDGRLASTSYTGMANGTSLHNVSFNAFTIDLGFSWFFSPGSEMSIVWKNAIFQEGRLTDISYGDNLTQLFQSPQLNSFSIKLLYYLDYLKVRDGLSG
jgi:hypothetical protein